MHAVVASVTIGDFAKAEPGLRERLVWELGDDDVEEAEQLNDD